MRGTYLCQLTPQITRLALGHQRSNQLLGLDTQRGVVEPRSTHVEKENKITVRAKSHAGLVDPSWRSNYISCQNKGAVRSRHWRYFDCSAKQKHYYSYYCSMITHRATPWTMISGMIHTRISHQALSIAKCHGIIALSNPSK